MAALTFITLIGLSGCSAPDESNCYMTVSGSSDTMERAAAAMRECEREQEQRRAQAMAAEQQRIAAINATATALVPTATPWPTLTPIPTMTPTPIATATPEPTSIPEPVRERVIVPTVIVYVTVNAAPAIAEAMPTYTPVQTATPAPQPASTQPSMTLVVGALVVAFVIAGVMLIVTERRSTQRK